MTTIIDLAIGRRAVALVARVASAAAALLAGAALAQGPVLHMFDRFEPGLWELRERDGGAVRRMCLASARSLVQIRHPGGNCRATVIEDTPSTTTVHYVCPGAGYGRTRLVLETPRLVQLETQGIADDAPFALSAEARRVGVCRG